MKTDESKLIAACKAGDRKAQKMLYYQYKNVLFSICRRYAQNNEEAEDFLQEGFIQIYTDLYQYKPHGSFLAWLKTVVVHVALKQVKKERKKKQTFDKEVWTRLQQESEEYREKPSREILIEMIQQLPDGYRTVFNLYAIEGYSHQEISEILDISVSTSKSQYHKAKRTLQRLFKSGATALK
ncbi:MAG: sigma-70 family RNA polymerase sigma factor [Bacteroidota bacterium]